MSTIAEPTTSPATGAALLLGCGAVAGALFPVVSFTQAFTRTGFDLRRHAISALTLGDLGWLQTANFALTGLLACAFALGVRRAARPGAAGASALSVRRAARPGAAGTSALSVRRTARPGAAGASALVIGPILIGAYGVAMVGGGVFTPDPALGWPAGAPAGLPEHLSTGSALHTVFGATAFMSLIVAGLVFARRFASRGWTAYSVISSLATFVLTVPPWGEDSASLRFAAGAVLIHAWLAALSLRLGKH
ncbi:DUF998 domain-containing protein [Nonomuraea jabiensis]|uniref:DUF998 domain-containing protein n=1 Tax=Nonomuraea jabiensis TaxID=882448 RepID=A0A7W9GBJ5_9ACTN|nr:DUF998 domain-containing protein [Nonomuraea jabiensis]MBB5780755.1 hypothetical protein [Nonomuraea jabiensis]